MIELGAIVLTIGAVLYHSLHVRISIISVAGVCLAIFTAIFFRTIRGVLFGLLIGTLLVLGALTFWRVDTPIPHEIFGKRAFEAKIASVDRRLDRTLIVATDTQYNQKLQMSVPGKNELLPGDKISVRGDVAAPEDFVTDNRRIFGYQAYLGSKGIVGIANNAIVTQTKVGKFSPRRFATTIRYSVADIFARYISFPFDGVLAGMVVGYQGGLPSSIQDLFRNTGVLHVLVLSGYNIMLLAGFLALLMKGVSFRARNVITIIAIVLLVLISGAGVASIRAGIMGAIAVFAGLSIRTYQPLRALSIAYLFFFFVSPQSVFVDPGFHLSFLATFFMIAVLPKVEKIFSFIPKTKHVDVREILMLAFLIPIFMLPYMMYFSGNFPLSSPFANIVFAVVTPLIMISGIIVVVVSWVAPVAALLGTVVSLGGSLLLWFLKVCERLPLWNTPALSWWVVSLVYVVGLGILFKREIEEYLVQQYTKLRQHSS